MSNRNKWILISILLIFVTIFTTYKVIVEYVVRTPYEYCEQLHEQIDINADRFLYCHTDESDYILVFYANKDNRYFCSVLNKKGLGYKEIMTSRVDNYEEDNFNYSKFLSPELDVTLYAWYIEKDNDIDNDIIVDSLRIKRADTEDEGIVFLYGLKTNRKTK